MLSCASMWLIPTLLLTCADDPLTDSAPEETALSDTADTADPCFEVPLIDWNTFGQSFILHNCQGCHASYTENRHDAPEDVTFDSVDQVWTLADRVLARATGDSATMPPQGGVTDDDRTRLEWWLLCAPEGT